MGIMWEGDGGGGRKEGRRGRGRRSGGGKKGGRRETSAFLSLSFRSIRSCLFHVTTTASSPAPYFFELITDRSSFPPPIFLCSLALAQQLQAEEDAHSHALDRRQAYEEPQLALEPARDAVSPHREEGSGRRSAAAAQGASSRLEESGRKGGKRLSKGAGGGGKGGKEKEKCTIM